jgi:AcrR family transcriptional regulator
MPATATQRSALTRRPKRADARRNYDKLIAAAREAFTERDSSASLEDIARRAGVGIGTLYRHFPTRTDLIEAVYVEEVETLCRSADDLRDAPPWDALVGWLHRFIGYVATKHALAEERRQPAPCARTSRSTMSCTWSAGSRRSRPRTRPPSSGS